MWIGEEITEHGVGNGISIVLLINIVSRIPDDFVTLFDQFMKGQTILNAVVAAVVIIAVVLVTVVFVIFLQDGERRIPVQYAKKMQGRKMVGGQSTNIPLKVNTAGVIPVIFAHTRILELQSMKIFQELCLRISRCVIRAVILDHIRADWLLRTH